MPEWCIDELIRHIDRCSIDAECGFLISACLSVLKLWVEPSGTEHVSTEHSSVYPHPKGTHSRRRPRSDSNLRTPPSKPGRHFSPLSPSSWIRAPRPHCPSKQSSSPEGPSGVDLIWAPSRHSFSELTSCITSLHTYFTAAWSKPTSARPCLTNCFWLVYRVFQTCLLFSTHFKLGNNIENYRASTYMFVQHQRERVWGPYAVHLSQ